MVIHEKRSDWLQAEHTKHGSRRVSDVARPAREMSRGDAAPVGRRPDQRATWCQTHELRAHDARPVLPADARSTGAALYRRTDGRGRCF